MKKVLSVLLAAAMVMGMSVSAFAAADRVWAATTNDDVANVHGCDLGFAPTMKVVHSEDNMSHGDKGIEWVMTKEAYEGMKPGDNLYFKLTHKVWTNDVTKGKWELVKNDAPAGTKFVEPDETKEGYQASSFGAQYTFNAKGELSSTGFFTYEWVPAAKMYVDYFGAIDKDWSINTKGNESIADAYFVAWAYNKTTDTWGYSSKAADLCNEDYAKFVCVEIIDELDNLTAQEAELYMYIADMDSDCTCAVCKAGHVARNCKSQDAYMNYTFDNETIKYVDFDFTNDADLTAKWVVAKNDKGTATFDFEDGAFFTVKMVSEEKVILNLSTAYDKAVDALFGYDADLSFYNFKRTKDAFTKTGELFIEADEETFVYEIVDGEIVEIEAEYVEEYKVANTSKAKAGWVIETKELGYYIVSDIEAEIEAEAEVEAPVEAEKANPETGAADFVGAAVAMAVVSVAAAGALALKK